VTELPPLTTVDSVGGPFISHSLGRYTDGRHQWELPTWWWAQAVVAMYVGHAMGMPGWGRVETAGHPTGA